MGNENARTLRRPLLPFRRRVWLPSTTHSLEESVRLIRKLAQRCRCAADRRADLEIAVREAVANAILHGNGKSPLRKFFLRCYGGPDGRIVVAVRDQGRGFDPESVPDPRSPERMHLETGRGLLLMRGLMDRVEYRKGGREVVLFLASAGSAEVS